LINIFPKEVKIEIPIEKSSSLLMRSFKKEVIGKAAFDKILEIKLNYLNLGMTHQDEVRLNLVLMQNERIIEQIPPLGALKIKLPKADYNAWQWSA